MNVHIERLIKNLEKQNGATLEQIQQLKSHFNFFSFPEEYIEILTQMNGAEGSIEGTYLTLYDINYIIETYDFFKKEKVGNGLIIFGTDTGVSYFSFLISTGQYVATPSTSLFIEDIEIMGNTFLEFLETLMKDF
ncbi:SMI1/KNR4 family protein [Runella aurantiaca]|uniref:Knr4/Smi1-like domain-containing protein n=1 Tax=Runella aurantiaca TaxID=2282308 RepID=A0A369ICQ0_9BACT|nr:SMI1/KNR4 family protein [Runella aurantiaca]RDB06207.1 hypothetical protein DVG78_10280 [Runella aurantiaca]